jgi:hypothetical protein
MSTEAAPYSTGANVGNGSATHTSSSTWKTLSTWRKVGRIEKHAQGIRIEYHDLVTGAPREVFITARDLHHLVTRQIPCDVVSVKETQNDIVTSTKGRAYRSRSGRAFVLRLVDMAGAEAMTPWKSLMMVLEGTTKAAPLSVMEEPKRPPTPTPAPGSTFDPRAGMHRRGSHEPFPL